MLARFGTSMPWLADVPGIQLLSVLPPWATSPASLILLGLLAILELVAAKIPELREVMSLSDAQIKSIAAFLLCFSIVKGNPMELVQHIGNVGLSTDFSWGQSFAYGWSFAIGTVVWFTAVMRNAVFGFLIEIDEDDSLGIQALLSWLEDSMGFLGVLFAVIFPTLALIAVGLTLLSLWLLRRYLEHREEKAKTPCTQCGAPNPPCGLYCASCNTARRRVQNVGLVGTIKETLASDLTAHRLQLLARKRCGYCGERLAEKRLSQHCGSCGTAPFENSAAVENISSSNAPSNSSHSATGKCHSSSRVDSRSHLLPSVSHLQLTLLHTAVRGLHGSLDDSFHQHVPLVHPAHPSPRNADPPIALPGQFQCLPGFDPTPVQRCLRVTARAHFRIGLETYQALTNLPKRTQDGLFRSKNSWRPIEPGLAQRLSESSRQHQIGRHAGAARMV